MHIWPYDPCLRDESNDLVEQSDSRLRADVEKSIGLPSEVTDYLRKMMPGRRIVLPQDATLYDKARKTFNARYDGLFPGAVVYCAQDQDIGVCIEAATKFNVPFRIRTSGHSFGGSSSLMGGIVVDISAMRSIRMLPRQEIYVEAGCNMEMLQRNLSLSNHQLPTGGAPVGVGGFMQGGGFSNATSRSLGMNCDNVTGIWMMLADKSITHASECLNHDLWWAVRGGTGGNFGVLLAATYRLHPARESRRWSCSLTISSSADHAVAIAALSMLQDIVLATGPEFNASVDIRYWSRHAGGTPEVLRMYVWGNYYGCETELEKVIHPLKKLLSGGAFDFLQHNKRLPLLRKARLTSALDKQDWTSLVADYVEHCNIHSTLTIDVWGGAINTYPIESSAFIHRDAIFNIYVTGFWNDEDEELKLRSYLDRWDHALQPVWTGGIYQNFADPDATDYTRQYWGKAYAALAACKQKFDPSNLFKTSQGVVASTRPVTWPPKVARCLGQPIQ